MALFKRGFDAEDRIMTKLEQAGCMLQKDQTLDHEHKLDFVVLRFPDIRRFCSLGVQVTTRLDDPDKMQVFLLAGEAGRVTDKSLYIELGQKVDLDAGGGLSVLTVLCEFQFNKAHAERHCAGVTIHDDLTYEFFDLTGRIRQLRARPEPVRMPTQPALPVPRAAPALAVVGGPAAAVAAPVRPAVPGAPVSGPVVVELEGIITSFSRETGYGFIQANDGATYFVHINKVTDEELRDRLNGIPFGAARDALEVPVVFNSAGFTKPSARYEESKNVRMRG